MIVRLTDPAGKPSPFTRVRRSKLRATSRVRLDARAMVRPPSTVGLGYVSMPDDGLGFSLKPPKWLRKAQPFKAISKIKPLKVLGKALPFAAALLPIPGVSALVSRLPGATTVSRFAAGASKLPGAATARKAAALAQRVQPIAQPVAEQIARAVTPAVASPPDMVAFATGSAPLIASQANAEQLARGISPTGDSFTDASAQVGPRTALEAAPTAMLVIGGLTLLALAGGVKKLAR